MELVYSDTGDVLYFGFSSLETPLLAMGKFEG